MFSSSANAAFNNSLFTSEQCGMPEMHETLRRLYEVARAATGRGLTPKELADALNESPQTITNWTARGVSAAGALKAEALYGAPAVYILGSVDGFAPEWFDSATMLSKLAARPGATLRSVDMEQAVSAIAARLDGLSDDDRERAASALVTLARAPDSQRANAAVVAALGGVGASAPIGLSGAALDLAREFDAIPDQATRDQAYKAAIAAVTLTGARPGSPPSAPTPSPSPRPAPNSRRSR